MTNETTNLKREQAIERARALGLDPTEYVTNDSLFGQCSPNEHYAWMIEAPAAEILSWAKSWLENSRMADEANAE